MRGLMRVGFVAVAAMTIAAAACSKQESATQTSNAPATVDISFKSDPETPALGENAFEAMVMQDGKPVDDAQVSVEFFMAAMPQMNMAEMRTRADLTLVGNGTYRGKGQVMMAGNWDVTIMAMKNGQEIGSKRLTVAAK